MFDLVGERLNGFDLIGVASLPAWIFALAAAFVAVVCTLVSMRGGIAGRSGLAVRIGVVLLIAVAGAWVLDHLAARDRAAERRAIDARAFELTMHALMPGSPLACLDATAGQMVENPCEKALFASPEATAAAVSYVVAQLSLLAAGRNHAKASGVSYWKMLTNVRRAVEADRFGIVAHVFATHGGCRPQQCDHFALLQDSSRVSANLAERPFDSFVKSHMAGWSSAGTQPVASNPGSPAAAPSVAAAKPKNLYFPSSASIPSLNIMSPEPAAPAQDASASADAAAQSRKSPPAAQQTRQPAMPNNKPAASTPLQIAPLAQ